MVSSLPGMRSSSWTRQREALASRLPLDCPRYMASMNRAVNWQVKALVEATPISGPACVISVPAASRVIMEPDHVADGQRLRALVLGLALGGQRVGGLAGLRDHDGQRVRPHDGIAIAELAAVIHFHGDARQLLDHELAGQRRRANWCRRRRSSPGGSARTPRADIHLVQENAAGFLAHAAQRGVAHGARLLKDFLEHEVLVAAFFRHDGIPQDMGNLAVDGAAVEIAQADAIGG